MSISTTPIADRLHVICDVCGKPRTGGKRAPNHARCSKVRQAQYRQQIPVGVPFEVGGIPCCKCSKCGVRRELAQFWLTSRNYHAAGREYVCTYCK